MHNKYDLLCITNNNKIRDKRWNPNISYFMDNNYSYNFLNRWTGRTFQNFGWTIDHYNSGQNQGITLF